MGGWNETFMQAEHTFKEAIYAGTKLTKVQYEFLTRKKNRWVFSLKKKIIKVNQEYLILDLDFWFLALILQTQIGFTAHMRRRVPSDRLHD